jgi:molecular chaperone GrpE
MSGDEPVVIRDNRKIDPKTGELRTPGKPAEEPVPGEANVPKAQELLLEERTRDLQRVQAEYANYRKRAERDRLAAGDLAVGRLLGDFLPVLDNIDRAREHGDLTGGLKAVADQLDAIFAKIGLVAFGEVGDPFDPAIHEAVMHNEGPDVSVPTCTTVLRPGYRYGERLVRPAMVGVTDPEPATEQAAANASEDSGEPTGEPDPSETNADPPKKDEGLTQPPDETA